MTDYEKLKQITDEIPVLISANITSSDAKFQAWKTKAERFLIKKYGNNSYEHTRFTKTYFSLGIFTTGTPDSEFVAACQNGLRKTEAIFQTYLEEMAEEVVQKPTIVQPMNYAKVFIVHGHDGELKQSVARIIEKQGIEAVILSEQVNRGKTIIEKFENYSDVGGAICLFTADDLGRSRESETDRARARQNVVFETGYFIGKLGRDHIAILADDGIEMPSDLSGVVRTNTGNWQFELLKELKAMGYAIDLNLLF